MSLGWKHFILLMFYRQTLSTVLAATDGWLSELLDLYFTIHKNRSKVLYYSQAIFSPKTSHHTMISITQELLHAPAQSSILSSRPHGCLKDIPFNTCDTEPMMSLQSLICSQGWALLSRCPVAQVRKLEVIYDPLSYPHIQFIAKPSWFDLLNASWIYLFVSISTLIPLV